jgi:adenosylmethionine-8-amino-7-oxononanoate aminotransferase
VQKSTDTGTGDRGASVEKGNSQWLSEAAPQLVRHSFVDFDWLESLSPGRYPRLIARGKGAYLYDDAGTALLDCGNHLAACAVGHGRGEIASRVAHQVETLAFATLNEGFTTLPAVQLADRLRPILPVEKAQLWYCSSGSEANEIAFKIARAYHYARREPGRVKILSRQGSYHGAGFGGTSAGGLPTYRSPFEPLVPGFVRTSQPSPGRCGYCTVESGCHLACAQDIERVILDEDPSTVAAFIAEPVSIVQAVKVPHPEYWARVRAICDTYGVLLIADEVITGFGRLGRMFGLERFGVRADIVTVAKAITSGYIPLGAAAISRSIQDVLRTIKLTHINTYAGHPVACVAALANLDIIERERLVEHTAALEDVILDELSRLQEHDDRIVNTSGIGLLASVEVSSVATRHPAEFTELLRRYCYDRGLIIRAFPGMLMLYPCLVVTEDEIRRAFGILRDALDHVA